MHDEVKRTFSVFLIYTKHLKNVIFRLQTFFFSLFLSDFRTDWTENFWFMWQSKLWVLILTKFFASTIHYTAVWEIRVKRWSETECEVLERRVKFGWWFGTKNLKKRSKAKQLYSLVFETDDSNRTIEKRESRFGALSKNNSMPKAHTPHS